MQLLKKIFDFYIFSNIHVALATFSLTKITLLQYKISENTIPFFVFFSTIVAYNLIRYYELNDSKDSWFRRWFYHNLVLLKLLTFISIFGILFFLKEVLLISLLLLIPFLLITIFYAIPILKYKGKWKSIRNYPTLKIFSIGIAWAGITVLFPLVNNKIDIDLIALLIFVQRILIVIVITIPFDIRDVSYDCSSLKTIPQVYGIKKTKYIGVILLMLSVIIEYFLISNGFDSSFRINLLIILIALILLLKSSESQSKYYSSFVVESIPIVWLFLRML